MSEINSENCIFSNPNVFNALANEIRIGISWKYRPKTRMLPLPECQTSVTICPFTYGFWPAGVRAGEGLQPPPPNIWAVRFFGQWRKFGRKAREGVFGKTFFLQIKIFLSSHLRPAKNKWLKFEEFMVSWGGLVCCQNLPQWCSSLQWYLLHLVQRNDRLVHFVYWKLTCEAPWDSSVSVT